MSPCDWTIPHSHQHSQCIVSITSSYIVTQSSFVQPSHLPVTFHRTTMCRAMSSSILHSHPSMSASIQPNCHPYCHVSACYWATSCMDCHVSSVQCHVSNPYRCQLSPKMPNLSDTCHLLVMPHQHDDIMMMS
jgi:hypothetical protein